MSPASCAVSAVYMINTLQIFIATVPIYRRYHCCYFITFDIG